MNFGNHSRLNSQHNWVDIYDHLLRKGIFTLTVDKIFMSSETEENGCRHILDLLITFTNVRIHTLQEVDAVLKEVHLRPIYHKAARIAPKCSLCTQWLNCTVSPTIVTKL